MIAALQLWLEDGTECARSRLAWTEDRATLASDPSVDPGAVFRGVERPYRSTPWTLEGEYGLKAINALALLSPRRRGAAASVPLGR